MVNFPFKNFDPTPYLASIPQETILRHKELLEHQQQQQHCDTDPPSPTDITASLKKLSDANDADEIIEYENYIGSIRENDIAEDAVEIVDVGMAVDGLQAIPSTNSCSVMSKLANEQCGEITTRRKTSLINPLANRNSITSPAKRNNKAMSRRKRLVSTSLTKTPVIDGEFIDFHKHNLHDEQDPYDLKYQLYAVVVSGVIYLCCNVCSLVASNLF